MKYLNALAWSVVAGFISFHIVNSLISEYKDYLKDTGGVVTAGDIARADAMPWWVAIGVVYITFKALKPKP